MVRERGEKTRQGESAERRESKRERRQILRQSQAEPDLGNRSADCEQRDSEMEKGTGTETETDRDRYGKRDGGRLMKGEAESVTESENEKEGRDCRENAKRAGEWAGRCKYSDR